MKKYLITMVLALAVLSPFSLYASTVNAGLSLWYAWLEPGFKNDFMGKNDNQNSNNNFDMTTPGAPIFGGLLSVQMTDELSLGAVVSYGKGWECEADYLYYNGSYQLHVNKTLEKLQRFESDLTMNYAINDMVKLFFGWKYFIQKGEGTYSYYVVLSPATTGGGEFENTYTQTGPGLGLTLTFNVADNIYVMGSVSGIYLINKTESERTGSSNLTTTENDKSFGPNCTLNLVYVIPDSDATISLGGRYQHLMKTDDVGTSNRFYGTMITAIYGF